MSIKEMLEKIKPFYGLLLILTVASIFFSLGRLSTLENDKNPIKIEYLNSSQTGSVILASSTIYTASTQSSPVPTTIATTSAYQDGPVIGSKSGKKYYFPWCGTVKRIKPENQVKFASIENARKAGFVPGGNCKGLK